MARFWLSFDLGFTSDHERLYEWLDENEAKECCENVSTFLSKKTKAQVAKELSDLVDKESRLYLIDMKSGGRFIAGKLVRKTS